MGTSLRPTWRRRLSKFSKLISQCELHYAGLREEPGVVAKFAGELLKRGSTVAEAGQDVEALEVWNVEDLPAELQAVGFLIRHFPTLAQTHVPSGEAVSA